MIIVSTLEDLKKEDILEKTSKGPFLRDIIDHLLKLDSTQIAELAIELCSELERCLPSKDKCVPSQMWQAFHKLRLSEKLKDTWSIFIMHVPMPPQLRAYTSPCYQIVVDRVFKHMIARKKVTPNFVTTDDSLIVREENVVHYMSGYVAFHLLSKYRKSTSDPELQSKWKYFTSVLEGMKTKEELPCNDSIEDYSRMWSEHIDRGGLCHVKPEVC